MTKYATLPRAALLALALVLLPMTAPRAAEPEVLHSGWIVIDSADDRGRAPFNPDALTLRYLLDRDATPPSVGEKVTGTKGTAQEWKAATVEEGALKGRFAMAYRSYQSDHDRVVLADVPGGSALIVNGTPYVGDVYRGGYGPVPVALRKGTNHLYIRGSRGQVKVTFTDPGGRVVVTGVDTTMPDLRVGTDFDSTEFAVVVANCTHDWMTITERRTGGSESGFGVVADRSPLRLAPLAVLKVPMPMQRVDPVPAEAGDASIPVLIMATPDEAGAGPFPAGRLFDMKVRAADKAWRRTFRSAIDDSVQEYAIRDSSDGGVEQVVLSVHGAGVKCLGQANAYSQRDGVWVVAATNRRKFGFDWQDWGRLDAYEVLGDVLERSGAPRDRVCLTGHSMGGHGTWHMAANDPDGFAAIGPSAGWSQFDNYGGRPDQAREQPWYGADMASDTMSLIGNLKQVPTFVVHGVEDDNVPLAEAKRMIEALEKAGARPQHHFEEGKKHWWNGDAAPGADCVDWPGIFELFAKSRIPDAPLTIDWTTVDPVIDAEHHWVRVEQPQRYGERVHVAGSWDPGERMATLRTENARLLKITWPDDGGMRGAVLDGQRIGLTRAPDSQWFLQDLGRWTAVDRRRVGEKHSGRAGPFKRGFGNRFVMIVGTAGTDEENRELLDRARYDSEQWRYRGNGLAEIVMDTDFAFGSSARFGGRNVIVYGNADTNAAWDLVFDAGCPIRPRRGSMTVGRQTWERSDLAAVFVHRRRGEPSALAAAFADSGADGTRLHAALLTFVSGVGYPDYSVFSPRALTNAKVGVLAAGWFDYRWKLPD